MSNTPDTQPTPKRMSNATKATTVGVSAGGTGALVITWLSTTVEQKYGIPSPVAAAVLGTLFGFLARWAAKLEPDLVS